MIPFLINLFFIALFMWCFFKFMYPKPRKAFMPKEGDIITPRECDFCGYPLAEYRGVLEEKPKHELSQSQCEAIDTYQKNIASCNTQNNKSTNHPNDKAEQHSGTSIKKLSRSDIKAIKRKEMELKEAQFKDKQAIKKMSTWFFCNYEHQAQFHNNTNSKKQPTRVKLT